VDSVARLLRSFTAVAEVGTVSAAAQTFSYSQPAVSVHIQLLEKRLGVELFIRHGRRLLLTECGLRINSAARQYLAGLAQLENEFLADCFSPGSDAASA
jgi:DNA-binding transcriptional LysR family regulator